MKTICVEEQLVLKYGFKGLADENFEIVVNNKYNKKNKYYIYITNNIKHVENESFLKVLYLEEKYDSSYLIPYNDVYVVRSYQEILDIISFYKKYDIKNLKKEDI